MKCKECQNKIKCEECGKIISSVENCYCGCHNPNGVLGAGSGCIHCKGYEITGGAGGTVGVGVPKHY